MHTKSCWSLHLTGESLTRDIINPTTITPEIMCGRWSVHIQPFPAFPFLLPEFAGRAALTPAFLESHTGLVHLQLAASFSVLGLVTGFSSCHRVGLDQIQAIYRLNCP